MLKTPNVATKPNRFEYEQLPAPKFSWRGAWLVAAVFTVITIVLVTTPWGNWLPKKTSTTQSQSDHGAANKIPWKLESTESLREGLKSLELKTYNSDPIPDLDAWHREVQSLKRNLDAVERKGP